MFADLLTNSEWSNHSHRGWTTLMSFALQALALGCLLLLPLFYTEGLPKLALIGRDTCACSTTGRSTSATTPRFGFGHTK
jgi:hypothetical protein